MKKIFALALALFMTLLPFTAFAAEEDVTTPSQDGQTPSVEADAAGKVGNISWSYYSQSGRLELKGDGAIPDFDETDAPWKKEASAATSLVVGDGITRIGEDAFSDMLSLSAITLPYSVVSIGEDAFYNTYYYNYTENWKLGVLYIGTFLIEANESVIRSYTVKEGTSCIADSAFEDCDTLYSLVLPEGVTHIGEYAFEGCETLKQISLPSTLKSVGKGATEGCDKLTSLAYSGTAENFAKVSVSSGNEKLRAAEKTFSPIESNDDTTAESGKKPIGFGSSCASASVASLAATVLFSLAAAFIIVKKK